MTAPNSSRPSIGYGLAVLLTLQLAPAQQPPVPQHWAFVAPAKPTAPVVQNSRWSERPIDRFVMRKLEAAGIEPSPSASKRTLIRRLSFDLTGLPPTRSEIQAFLADDSADGV